ncbi:MAG: hypothetical protein LPJ89_05015 [Hymenobacteraceae bacterium]|nr:hypothetical protein [Hymenobacteraceae bacterium]MDX5395943.1 hypothetical protein [Hymenobacteraceae bacterium]MDX5443127.1 hypothetical protein [Hymenobacteraceae bacterium]MDX5512001.1 hypothetical protein [Hymenobacteraceae bacterium]
MKKYLTRISCSLLLCTLLLSSCYRTEEREEAAEENVEENVEQTERAAERDWQDFKEWVNTRANRVDSSAREEWPEIKREYKERVQALDRRSDSLSAESRREYQELKQKYKSWEEGRESRLSIPLSADTLATFEKTLLGPFATLSAVPAHQMKEAYVYFMKQVRDHRSHWTPADWDYVNHLYRSLNARKEAVEEQMATSDKLKVKALQTEYLTFEAANDARDLGERLND